MPILPRWESDLSIIHVDSVYGFGLDMDVLWFGGCTLSFDLTRFFRGPFCDLILSLKASSVSNASDKVDQCTDRSVKTVFCRDTRSLSLGVASLTGSDLL